MSNKRNFIIALYFIVFIWPVSVNAIRTNQNEVTDFFDKNISNKEDVYQITRDLRQMGLEGIKTRSSEREVEGHQQSDAKAKELGQIRAIDLDNAGRDKRRKDFQYYDDSGFEVDFEKPSNKHLMDYAETLSDKSGELIKELIAAFKELDIDCKTVKGPVEKEPVYVIEMEREEERPNTHYDQHFCENLRNTYSCVDSASIRCKKRGMLWKDWQKPVTIKISGPELVGKGYHFFYSAHVARNVFELKLFGPNSLCNTRRRGRIGFNSVPEMRRYLADRHGLTIDHISDDMSFGWEGGVYGLGGKGYAWHTYIITYRIRDGEEICKKWSDPDWTERCRLNG